MSDPKHLEDQVAALLAKAGLSPADRDGAAAFISDMSKPSVHVPNEAFEQWFVELRTPTPVDPISARWASMADFFWGSDKEDLVRQIQEIANSNDVDGLRRMREVPLIAMVLEEGTKGHSPATTYCVAHMLVDGSGNEEFAREWIFSTGHSAKLASAHFNHLSLASDRSKLQNQKLLGLSTVLDVFHRPGWGEVPFANLGGRDDPPSRVLENCLTLAAILRLHHPEKPPRADWRQSLHSVTEQPLIETLWSGDRFHNLLPAIEQAYGRGNPQVEREMAHHLRNATFNGKLQVSPSTTADTLWQIIEAWSDSISATDVLRAKGADNEVIQKTLMDQPDYLVLQRLEQFKSMGVSLDDLVEEDTLVGKSSSTLLHRAILKQKVEVVAWLLMNDCDPLIKSQSQLAGGDSHDGVDYAKLKESTGEDGAKIASMVRSAVASRAAHDVLKEMGLSAPRGVRP